jgi:two-component system nitrogen regulation response regulator NtrX
MKSILIVDDEKEICRSLKGILVDENYQVKISYSPEDAFEQIQVTLPHLVLLDIWFGKGSGEGLVFLEKLQQRYPFLPVIIMSGHGTLELAVRAIQKGAYDFIEKPIDVERLLLTIMRTFELAQFKKLQLSTQCMHKSWALPLDPKLKKASASQSRILLIGERGMEHQRLAYEIHKTSLKKESSFIISNAYDLNRLSEEAFFGVSGHKPASGLLDLVGEGTWLIRHAHMLSPRVQCYFEKIFETHSYTRINSDQEIFFNVRFIFTAPHEFLENGPKPSHINTKFYDRITISPFTIHSLRSKRQDIGLWANFFLKELTAELGEPPQALSEKILHVLQAYAWPGNLKELYNALEHALIFSNQAPLKLEHFPSAISHVIACASIFSMPIQKARAVFEYNYLSAQLAAVNGNVSQAAPIVGMERSALHRKLKYLKQTTTEVENFSHKNKDDTS